MFRVIFGVDTPAGKAFDVALLWSILLSIVVVMLDSVETVHNRVPGLLTGLEWGFTGLFTAEYIARLVSVRRPLRYAVSVFGLIDVLAVLPTYLGLFFGGAQSLLVIRTLRLLRVFRVLHLTQYLTEANTMLRAMRASRPKIVVFLLFVLSVSVIIGAAMYLIEGPERGFTSIPRGMYWAIVTLTTVGYGDITPDTVPGQALAAMLMILGYSIIAVPTGIISVEYAQARATAQEQPCPDCGELGHDRDAHHCKYCGGKL